MNKQIITMATTNTCIEALHIPAKLNFQTSAPIFNLLAMCWLCIEVIYSVIFTHIMAYLYLLSHDWEDGEDVATTGSVSGKNCLQNATIGWWVCLLIINIVVAILLNSQSVYSFLSAFYLPWLPTVLCGLLAAVSVFSVIENLSTGYMAMGLQANVEEIQTLLKYNKFLVRRDNY